MRLEQILQASRDLGVDVLAYSPLAFGVCANRSMLIANQRLLCAASLQSAFPAVGSFRCIQSIARARQVTMVQVALNWCRSNGTFPFPV